LVEIAGDCDCTTVADSPTTVTFSAMVPTCIVTLTAVGMPAAMLTFLDGRRAEARQFDDDRVAAAGDVRRREAAVTTADQVDLLTRAVVLDLDVGAGDWESLGIDDRPDNVVKILPCANAGAPIARISANARHTYLHLVLKPLITTSCNSNTNKTS
jgi:hypothetical protein